MVNTKREILQRRWTELNNEASAWIPHWREITQYLSPMGGRLSDSDRNNGNKQTQYIINATATKAHNTLKSGLHAGMTSQSRPWFRLIIQDSDKMKIRQVKEWLSEVETQIRIALAKSNFYNTLPLIYGGTSSHNISAMAILEDPETDIRCYTFPIGQYRVALNDRLKVDTIYRRFPMTVDQLVRKFGLDNVSKIVKSLWDNSSYQTVIYVYHAIEPNLDRDTASLLAKEKPWRSVYWEENGETDKYLEESGFDEFPCMTPRWDVEGDDMYRGASPGIMALGLIKGLQFMEKRKAEAVDKLVRPPMAADSSLRNRQVSILSGGITYIDGMAASGFVGMKPLYEVRPQTADLRADIEAIKQEIKGFFFEDLMLMFAQSDASNITAEEVRERHQEKLLVLGPTIERFGEELYDPIIDRVFPILHRLGKIPPAPKEIAGQPLKVEYISVMAAAQKLVGASSLERVAGFIGNLAAIAPEAMDKLSIDFAIDNYADMYGTEPKIIRTDDEVKNIRDAKAKQEQMKQMAEMAPAVTQAATAAKTLSDISVDEQSLLRQMSSGGSIV